jgi:hypothetical protein
MNCENSGEHTRSVDSYKLTSEWTFNKAGDEYYADYHGENTLEHVGSGDAGITSPSLSDYLAEVYVLGILSEIVSGIVKETKPLSLEILSLNEICIASLLYSNFLAGNFGIEERGRECNATANEGFEESKSVQLRRPSLNMSLLNHGNGYGLDFQSPSLYGGFAAVAA